MVSGFLDWYSGNLSVRGTRGLFWTSTLSSYAFSRDLGFASTEVVPKNNSNKPYGLSIRCVARFTCIFLPELSAAFLFRLCCRALSSGSVVISAIEVRAATSGHLRLAPTQLHGPCTSTPLTSTLRVATVSPTASPSAASPNEKTYKKSLTTTSLLYRIILVHFEQKLTASRLYT